MENSKIQLDGAKNEYTLEILKNDIVNFEKYNNNKNEVREYNSKLIVLEMMIKMSINYRDKFNGEDEELKKNIEDEVNKDFFLSGYLFYISQNPQFDYSWNYMRMRKTSYVEFLVDAILFFNNVIDDILMLTNMIDDILMLTKLGCHENDIHIVFNDFFNISLTKETPMVHYGVIWKNFDHLISVKREYPISIKINESILIAGKRKDKFDIRNLCMKCLCYLKTFNNNLKK